MFYATYALGSYPMGWIDEGVAALSGWVESVMPASIFKDLLVDGIINGVGSVAAFLPNILILFLFISLFEETGYMERATLLTDKLMHTMGLHGKSFVPLIMGFGCNVPAIMATRIIENRTQRMLTMLLIPFMSCSARLPVYILLIGAFFPHHAGSVLFLVYLTGIVIAILSGLLFSKVLFKENYQPNDVELSPYSIPSTKKTLLHVWQEGAQYLKKMGGTILIAAVVIWALNTFPQSKSGEPHRSTYLEQLGHAIEPAMRPLGFDWKMSVSLLTGVVAKETVVSTLGVIYQDEEDGVHLAQRLRDEQVFTTRSACSFLVFILLYFPCVAAITAILRESGSTWIAALAGLYTTAVAWLVAFIVYQVSGLLL
jgi:ferrous iron transport protein B